MGDQRRRTSILARGERQWTGVSHLDRVGRVSERIGRFVTAVSSPPGLLKPPMPVPALRESVPTGRAAGWAAATPFRILAIGRRNTNTGAPVTTTGWLTVMSPVAKMVIWPAVTRCNSAAVRPSVPGVSVPRSTERRQKSNRWPPEQPRWPSVYARLVDLGTPTAELQRVTAGHLALEISQPVTTTGWLTVMSPVADLAGRDALQFGGGQAERAWRVRAQIDRTGGRNRTDGHRV